MRGATLIELIVVLAILGVAAGMGLLSVVALKPLPSEKWIETVRHARSAAINSGRPITLTTGTGSVIRYLPDGRAIGIGVDPLTGDLQNDSQ